MAQKGSWCGRRAYTDDGAPKTQPRPAGAPVTTATTFGERFLAEFADVSAEAVQRDIGVLRRRAVRVLHGIPWQFIPTERCEGRAIVGLRGLLMLCCCLDCVQE